MLLVTQYTLSEETISYLKHPTFDIWHWETNEVRINYNKFLTTITYSGEFRGGHFAMPPFVQTQQN